uniref:Sodium/potassium-transporting ATPase subunit beta-like protein n=1 Tax=Metapenaeus joyneri majanivirus TaxID=2984280 RepID=A0A9C7BWH0_9VIRU|nr:MAG: sodium/potassium-transporting ATPase subunit beta-like protein [Metapenaeus joyneri majanivirus]
MVVSLTMKVVIVLSIIAVATIAVGVTFGVLQNSSPLSISRGLQVIPRANPITYTVGDIDSVQSYIQDINNTLAEYDRTPDDTFIECNDTVRPKGKEVCIRNSSILKSCRPDINFGFEGKSPCVLLRLYLEDSFKPDPYQSLDDLPDDFPADLRYDAERAVKEFGELPQGIWVDCSSNVNLLEPYSFFPDYFFDNIGAKNYMPPFIAVQFDLSNRIDDETVIECKAWAKNINHDKDDFSKVSFTLYPKSSSN